MERISPIHSDNFKNSPRLQHDGKALLGAVSVFLQAQSPYSPRSGSRDQFLLLRSLGALVSQGQQLTSMELWDSWDQDWSKTGVVQNGKWYAQRTFSPDPGLGGPYFKTMPSHLNFSCINTKIHFWNPQLETVTWKHNFAKSKPSKTKATSLIKRLKCGDTGCKPKQFRPAQLTHLAMLAWGGCRMSMQCGLTPPPPGNGAEVLFMTITDFQT